MYFDEIPFTSLAEKKAKRIFIKRITLKEDVRFAFDENPLCVPVNILLVRVCIFQLEIRNTCIITRT